MLAMLECMTVDEYLAFDRAAERPHEYIAGTLCLREGANFQHCLINSNVLRAVGNALEASPFRVYAPPMRVQAGADVYLYPDVSIGFGPAESGDPHNDILINPVVVVEVISPETELRDRGIKFKLYRSIPSLQAYALVSQNQAIVECFYRISAQQGWMFTDAQGLDSVINLPGVEIDLPLQEIYDRIDFPSIGELA